MITPTIQRKPKKKQTVYINKLNQENIKLIKSCLKSLHVVETILDECEKRKIQNIFVVDGPNMAYWKEKTFKTRQAFLLGRKFRNILLMNTVQTETNLFLIISQKEFTKDAVSTPTCEQMMSISNMMEYKKQYFMNISVACYDKNIDERCMFPNEIDDYTRKYLSVVLSQKFRQYKKYIPIYEISNDESKNWLIDSRFKVPRIPFQTTLFREKKETATPMTKPTTTLKPITMTWKKKQTK